MSSLKEQHSTQDKKEYVPIGDYGVIGDLHTVALVGKNGSIDWCCLPRFDSPSVFAAILDANKGGFFRLCPSDTHQHIARKQIYIPETNVLVTRFLTADGIGEITDFMPIKQPGTDGEEHTIIRSVTVVSGSLSFEMTCRPAFNYARDTSTITLLEHGASLHSQSSTLILSSPISLQEDAQGGVQATFTVHAGQPIHFVLKRVKESRHEQPLLTDDQYQKLLQETIHYWRNWLSQCTYRGRWREMVQRSALALKLLIYAPTGAIVAAPTTSLPEDLGGDRNWDYRYTWLRDASFSLYSLLALGFTEEAEAFMRWLNARCHERKDSDALQPMYGIDGSHELKELTLDHLEGYRKSVPVHISNGAYTQMQLDVYGEVMDAIYLSNRHTAISYQLWEDIIRLLDWLTKHWQEPDAGLWEVRGDPKHYVDSRMMSWVAFDRALRLARHQGFPATMEEWTKTSAQIYRQVMEQGWSEQEQSFVQRYGSNALDASALLMVTTRFTSPTDLHMLSTIERIQRELEVGALVHRYSPEEAEQDGLGSVEGTFNACSFWLAEVLARAGRVDEARLFLEKILSYSNEVGLYSEKLSSTGEALGNYPQALTHLALISACDTIDRALDAKYQRA